MKTELKTFNDLVKFGSFLRENRRLQGIKLEEVSRVLIIKKDILKSFEEGKINLENNSYLKGFLISYIKFLNLEDICKLELPTGKNFSNLEKSNFQLEASGIKKSKYGSIIILLSLIIIGLLYMFWNKNTYLNLYLIGVSIN